MKKVMMYRWQLLSDTIPGKVIKTRHLMTEAEAKARDPNAVPISAGEERLVAEPGDDMPTNSKPPARKEGQDEYHPVPTHHGSPVSRVGDRQPWQRRDVAAPRWQGHDHQALPTGLTSPLRTRMVGGVGAGG